MIEKYHYFSTASIGLVPNPVIEVLKDYLIKLSLGGTLCYWDLLTGFSAFPTQIPAASLPIGYETLVPGFTVLDFAAWANQANLTYLNVFDGVFDVLLYNNLLQPYTLWGIPPF